MRTQRLVGSVGMHSCPWASWHHDRLFSASFLGSGKAGSCRATGSQTFMCPSCRSCAHPAHSKAPPRRGCLEALACNEFNQRHATPSITFLHNAEQQKMGMSITYNRTPATPTSNLKTQDIQQTKTAASMKPIHNRNTTTTAIATTTPVYMLCVCCVRTCRRSS